MYAEIVIDINIKEVDRPFTYKVPDRLLSLVSVGASVRVPFGRGNSLRQGYVLSLLEKTDLPPEKVKEIDSLVERGENLKDQLIELAFYIRDRFGGTLYQALSLTVPGDKKTEAKKDRFFIFKGSDEELETLLLEAKKKKHYAKLRLLEAFSENRILPASIVTDRLNITGTTLKPFQEKGLLEIEYQNRSVLTDPLISVKKTPPELNPEQKKVCKDIYYDGRTTQLLFGVTGSGKTEVYLKLIENVLSEGKEAIVLIPEIALTYQTVMRFYERFGSLVSVVHSRVSKGEKCERFRMAEEGRVKVMIGPRSALFTPFKHLGMIIIDEFHEMSYISEQVPKYNAVDVAIHRAESCNAKVILGSATPSVEAFYKAKCGDYALHELKTRAVKGSLLPTVHLVDMREELKNRNRSVFSGLLKEKIEERLQKKEQIMLFLNRRGYSGAVTCRTCGTTVRCPHCSVSMNYHRNGRLKCHICGTEMPMVKICPSCGSGLIGSFGIGTEKIEEMVKSTFPDAVTLRMDADTTKGKNGHEEILEKFRNREADILIGTQMIVKGHDFPDVTLVGILAADLSLNVPDYRSAERTFQLLVQAEGRAGRGQKPGECIVQTYNPEHYAVLHAVSQNYEAFYENEMVFRNQMKYPPAGTFMGMMVSGASAEDVHRFIGFLYEKGRNFTDEDVLFLGPVEAGIHKVKDMYREILYMKSGDKDKILKLKRFLEITAAAGNTAGKLYVSFE